MIYNRINLMLPTYGRSGEGGKLEKFITSAFSKAKDPWNTLRFTFVVNEKDEETRMFIDWVFAKLASQRKTPEGVYLAFPRIDCVIYENLEKPHLAKYFNQAYEQTAFQDPDTVVSMVGDDMEFQTENWDELLLKWVNMFNGVGIFFGDDCKGTGDNLCVNLFTTRKFVDAQKPKPFMCELFPIDDMDVIWNFVGKKLNRRFYIPELKIFHNHATLPGQMDAVWQRLREQSDTVRANRTGGKRDGHVWGNEAYEDECVELIRENLKDELTAPIVPVFTTKDRVDLLRDTVRSYVSSAAHDTVGIAFAYDDYSDDWPGVQEALKPAVCYLRAGEQPIGVGKATPQALELAFGLPDAQAAIVIDSDSYLHKYWWPRAVALYHQYKDNAHVGCVSLHNSDANPAVSTPDGSGLVKKLEVGGLGMLITRGFFEKYIKPYWRTDEKKNWDYQACYRAIKDGKQVFASSPSFIQHLGTHEGTHVGQVSKSYASDFIGVCGAADRYAVDPEGPEDRVLFCLPARHGDIVMGSFMVNMLIEMGYKVSWLTMPFYTDQVRRLCPRAALIISGAPRDSRWEHYTTKQIRAMYPRYRYYINAQPGAAENHTNLFNSGRPMYDFSKNICERVIGRTLPSDYLTYSEYQPLANLRFDNRNGKPIAVIAPEVHSIPTLIDDKMLAQLRAELEKDYDVRIMVEKSPNLPYRLRREYVSGLHFMQAVDLLGQAELFIGNDSGLAWGALLHKSLKKRILHHKWRITQTHVYYNRLDPNAEDVII